VWLKNGIYFVLPGFSNLCLVFFIQPRFFSPLVLVVHFVSGLCCSMYSICMLSCELGVQNCSCTFGCSTFFKNPLFLKLLVVFQKYWWFFVCFQSLNEKQLFGSSLMLQYFFYFCVPGYYSMCLCFLFFDNAQISELSNFMHFCAQH